MVDPRNVIRMAKEPYRVGRYLNKWYYRAINSGEFNDRGVSFFEKDWDNLVLLDACRYDTFVEESQINGTLGREVSMASATPEYIASNLRGEKFHDVVYISANGYLTHFADKLDYEFHALFDFFEPEYWDDTYQTVMPEVLTERALKIAAEYPDKRVVVHYIQPHWPFISDIVDQTFNDVSNYAGDDRNFWMAFRSGDHGLTDEQLRTAYRDTLRRTLPSLRRLVDALDGKTVVTSDHGQMLGERSFPLPIREYGHPEGTYTPELVDVPWLVVPHETRKEIIAESPERTEAKETDEGLVRERLQQLGYAE
jgi:hypothetical protein